MESKRSVLFILCILGQCERYIAINWELFKLSDQFQTKRGIHESSLPPCYHKDGLCIYKCCKNNEFVYKKKVCRIRNGTSDFRDLKVYDENGVKATKTPNDLFSIVENKFSNEQFWNASFDLQTFSTFKLYLTEKGNLVLETPNSYPRFSTLHSGWFCLDHKRIRRRSPYVTRVWVVIPKSDAATGVSGVAYKIVALSVTIVFLGIVFAIYTSLTELHTVSGWILTACVACLFWPQIWYLYTYVGNQTIGECLIFSYITYYLHMAAYLWMNVMFFDIWWETRSRYKNSSTIFDRRGACFKFIIYFLYAQVLPLIPAICFVVLNSIPLDHLPNLVTPRIPQQGCKLSGWPKVFYLHIPLLISITMNWLFFLGTAYLKVCAKRIGNTTFPRLKYRLQTYLKLLIVVTLEQVLSMLTITKPTEHQRMTVLADTCLFFLGPMFFLVFVWRRETRRVLLEKLLRTWNLALNRGSALSTDGSPDMTHQSMIELQSRDNIIRSD